MTIDVGMYSDSEIEVALGVAIKELGFGKVVFATPYDFSTVRYGEYRLTLAESPDIEKHAAYSCLDQNNREA